MMPSINPKNKDVKKKHVDPPKEVTALEFLNMPIPDKNAKGLTKIIPESAYPDACRELAAAVISQAVEDYRTALQKLKFNPELPLNQSNVDSIDIFFRGSIVSLYLETSSTNLTGEAIIRELRRQVGVPYETPEQAKKRRKKNSMNGKKK